MTTARNRPGASAADADVGLTQGGPANGWNNISIIVSWNEDVMEIGITGQASKQNANEIAEHVIKMLSEHRPDKVSVDCTRLVGRLSLVNTYYHARHYPGQRHRPVKLAVLDVPKNKGYFSFHETTADAGAPIKYFTDSEKAVKWLKQYPNDLLPNAEERRAVSKKASDVPLLVHHAGYHYVERHVVLGPRLGFRIEEDI